jgi:hypothetical protein
MDFSFGEFYSFLLTALGMILAYLGGRRERKKREKDNNKK